MCSDRAALEKELLLEAVKKVLAGVWRGQSAEHQTGGGGIEESFGVLGFDLIIFGRMPGMNQPRETSSQQSSALLGRGSLRQVLE